MRRLLVAAAAGAALAVAAPVAHAARECDGLDVCVPVAGPWVVVPSGPQAPRASVRFQVTCPRNHVVAGVDAELSHRAVDVTWAGLPGSPVGPGVSTQRSLLFTGVFTGTRAAAASYRPRIGCIPSAGGGGRIPTSVGAVYPPSAPPVRRVRTARVRAGATLTISHRCAAGEVLVDAWHAVGFAGAQPPTATAVGAVRATRSVRRGRLVVTARAAASIGARQVFVQAGVTCGGAP